LAAAAGVAVLTAADVDDRADARSVVDSLGAVALYTAVREHQWNYSGTSW
jgi:hypothetical protein